jgi:hypothetical protein
MVNVFDSRIVSDDSEAEIFPYKNPVNGADFLAYQRDFVAEAGETLFAGGGDNDDGKPAKTGLPGTPLKRTELTIKTVRQTDPPAEHDELTIGSEQKRKG